jgi:hypothetical protein
MADYRFYHLLAAGIAKAEVHDCADDAAALCRAHGILAVAAPACDAVEIWQLTRLIGLVRRGDAASPGRSGRL